MTRKINFFLICVYLGILSVVSPQAQTARENKSKSNKEIKINKKNCLPVPSRGRITEYNCSPTLENLILSEREIKQSCDLINGYCSDAAQSITVRTIAADPENDVITYDYKVSSGKIEYTGWQVKWNLSGVKRGTHSISVCVSDSDFFCRKTITKKVRVTKCSDCK